MRKILKILEARPYVVTVAIVVLGIAEFVTAQRDWFTSAVGNLLRDASDGAGVAVALGMSSVAAIVAGFVGVIVVFGLGSDNAIIISFRHRTGSVMRSNWISVIGSSFASAILGFVGAILLAASSYQLAGAVLCVGMLLLCHAIIRTLWLFGVLMTVIATGDAREDRRRRTRSTSDIFRPAA
ncbi:RexB family abortive infection protein [Gordonia phage Sidious]|uniref:RexB family abortive infection protein n=1 Tax=Gordonia phage Sidious TaxID=2591118 RepID=A0A515MIB0_9CAUD|nr:RexB family abortive infection protein [Gordonia phage Sidious]QDM56387.1 RexB family abortive infection protein [Gordonia phage Sidious]